MLRLMRRKRPGRTVSVGGGNSNLAYAPRYTLPTNVQYNAVTKLCDFTSAKVAWMTHATYAPTVWVTVNDTGSTAGNKSALQAAINAAVAASGTANVDNLRGIRLKASVEYGEEANCSSVALLDNNGIGRWMFIQSEFATTTLRAEGQRVGLDDAAKCAKFGMQTYNANAIRFSATTKRIRMDGLHFRTDPAQLATLRAGQFGYPGNNVAVTFNNEGFIGFKPYAETTRPTDIILSRCLFEGDDQVRYRRVIEPNFDSWAVLDSWIENPGDPGNGDSQCIAAWGSQGDGIIYNNEIAGALGETVAFGGSDTKAAQWVTKDISIIGNLFTFRLRWSPPTASNPSGQNRLHKNAFELKHGIRILFERNKIENMYLYGRLGNQFHPIIVKSSDQGTGEAWSETRDITLRFNELKRCSGTVSILSRQAVAGSGDFKAVNRIEFSHMSVLPWDQTEFNLGWMSPWQFVPVKEAGTHAGDSEWYTLVDVSVHNCTLWGADQPGLGTANYQSLAIYDRSFVPPVMTRFEWQNNVMALKYPELTFGGNFFIGSQAYGTMPSWWNTLTRTGVQTAGNFVNGVTDVASQLTGPWGSSNVGVDTLAAMNLDATTLALTPSSPGKGIAVGGGDPGCDLSLLASVTGLVATGRGGSGAPNFTALPQLARQVPDASLFASRRSMTSGQSFNDPTTGAKVIKITDSTTDPLAAGVGVANYSEGGPYVSQRWGGTNYTIHLGGEFVEVNGNTGAIIRRTTMPFASSTCMGFSMDPATPRMLYYLSGSKIYKYDTETQTAQTTAYIPSTGLEMRYNLDGLVGDEFYVEWMTVCMNDDWIAMQANNKRKIGSLVNDYFCFFSPKTGVVVANHDADNNQLQASRDGSSALLATNTQTDTRIFRRATNDIQIIAQPNGGHPAAMIGVWGDVDSIGNLRTLRFDLSTLAATYPNLMQNVFAGTGTHNSGHYPQPAAAPGAQYYLSDAVGSHACAPTGGTWTLVSGNIYSAVVDWAPQYQKPAIGIQAVLQYSGAAGFQSFNYTLLGVTSQGAMTAGTYFYNSATQTVYVWQVGGGTPMVRLYAAAGNMMGLAFIKADGTDARLLCHHGNDLWQNFSGSKIIYDRFSFGTWSPNGIACLFRSTFGINSGRADWYLALAPETT